MGTVIDAEARFSDHAKKMSWAEVREHKLHSWAHLAVVYYNEGATKEMSRLMNQVPAEDRAYFHTLVQEYIDEH